MELWTRVWAPYDQQMLIRSLQELVDLGRHAFARQVLRSVCELPAGATNLAGAPLLLNRLKSQSSRKLRTLISGIVVSTFGAALKKSASADAWNEVLVTAIALKRFQLKYGHWPDALEELVPEFLPRERIDRMDGQPLRYHRREDGTFLLYSVGEDGIDQNGEPDRSGQAVNWQRDQDFVWPQAAPGDEVIAADAEAVAKAATKAAETAPDLERMMMKRYGLLPPDAGSDFFESPDQEPPEEEP